MFKGMLLLFLGGFTYLSYADEIPVPEYSGEVTKYKDRFDGELLVAEKTNQELKFWFRIVGGNYHQCHMAGTAKSGDSETYKYSHSEMRNNKLISCSLSLVVLDSSVVLIDKKDQCKLVSCGQRAGISGAVFHLAE